MDHIITILAVVFVVIIGLTIASKLKGRSASSNFPKDHYYLRPSVVSPAERSFLGVLQTLNYEGIIILTKVRIADVVGIRKGLEARDRQAALNRVVSKHVDFLLVQESDARPVVAIELDDSTHDRPDRSDRDSFVDQVFHSVGLPLLHIKASASYNPRDIHAAIEGALPKPG
jgi:hypothetical protein